jgi:hypothetical protein
VPGGDVLDAPVAGAVCLGPARDDPDPAFALGPVDLRGQRLDIDRLRLALGDGGVEDHDGHLRADGQVA